MTREWDQQDIILVDLREMDEEEKRLCVGEDVRYSVNPFSILGYFLAMSFGGYWTILLTLGRVYGGQRINSLCLYYFNPDMSFCKCTKSPTNRQSKMKMRHSTEGVHGRKNIENRSINFHRSSD